MSTYRETVYMVLDELKLFSDDASFTEEHVRFLLDKYRLYILKQQYEKEKKEIPESNYQTLCLDLVEVPPMEGFACEGQNYLRSKEKIPSILPFGNPKVYPTDFYSGNISFVSRERMKYVGCNKYLKNIIYCSIGPDNYLYFKSENPQFLYLQNVRFTALFEKSEDAEKLACEGSNDGNCDWLDNTFPIEESFIPLLIQAVVQELAGPLYRPEDDRNNANDDLSTLHNYIARNSKSELQKELSK